MRRDATKGSDPLVAFRGEVVFGDEQSRMVLSAEWVAGGLRWFGMRRRGQTPLMHFAPWRRAVAGGALCRVECLGGLRWSEGVTKATKGSDPFDAFRRAWLLFDF